MCIGIQFFTIEWIATNGKSSFSPKILKKVFINVYDKQTFPIIFYEIIGKIGPISSWV